MQGPSRGKSRGKDMVKSIQSSGGKPNIRHGATPARPTPPFKYDNPPVVFHRKQSKPPNREAPAESPDLHKQATLFPSLYADFDAPAIGIIPSPAENKRKYGADKGNYASPPAPKRHASASTQSTQPRMTTMYSKSRPNQSVNNFYGSTRPTNFPSFQPPHYAWEHTNTGGAGFRNLGNTCYMNAVLQVVLSLPEFTKQLQQEHHISRILPDSVLAALAELAKDMKSGRGVVTPSQVKKAMGARSEAFQGYMQQDAHEFFCDMLDAVSTELNSPAAKQLLEPDVTVAASGKPLNEPVKDPGAEAFSFTVLHSMKCCQCGATSCVEEEFNHLSIELPSEDTDGGGVKVVADDVETMLKRYFQDEDIEKQCEHCSVKTDVAHELSHKIKKTPKVLALHIKRFLPVFANDTFSFKKLTGRIKINEILRLNQFVCTRDDDGPADSDNSSEKENNVPPYSASKKGGKPSGSSGLKKGTLHAVITHHGREATSGHYTADINKNNNWVRFNDSRTENITKQRAVDETSQRGCYMVFYDVA